MIKTVSYSLFAHPDGGAWKSDGTPGRLDGYIRYLPSVIRAHHVWWGNPGGWGLVLHHDGAVTNHPYFGALVRMQQEGLIELVDCIHAYQVGYGPMWRFMPAFRGDDRIVLCHDLDSFPMPMLRRIGEEFFSYPPLNTAAAVVHGCESHNTAMAGLFLLKSWLFRAWTGVTNFVDFMSLDGGNSMFGAYGTDELYLRDVVWPKLEHRSTLYRVGNRNPSLINSADVRYDIQFPIPAGMKEFMYHMGNGFAPYPGAAGFDLHRALGVFTELEDDYEVLRKITACEQGHRTAREVSFP